MSWFGSKEKDDKEAAKKGKKKSRKDKAKRTVRVTRLRFRAVSAIFVLILYKHDFSLPLPLSFVEVRRKKMERITKGTRSTEKDTKMARNQNIEVRIPIKLVHSIHLELHQKLTTALKEPPVSQEYQPNQEKTKILNAETT